jgi:phosphohistidine phosphatase SixA
MRIIAAFHGEADFDDNESTRSGRLTDLGRSQMAGLRDRLAREVGSRVVMVVSNSRRGQTVADLFRQSGRFADVDIVMDLSYRLDDSHPVGTFDVVLDVVIAFGKFDTVVVVGSMDRVIEFCRKLAIKLHCSFPAKEIPDFAKGQAFVFDVQTREGKVV